ncbi:MAG: DoxX family protein [Burkholderiales bacterium]|nr:DoxX family protein [Burkholderiales bacterium]
MNQFLNGLGAPAIAWLVRIGMAAVFLFSAWEKTWYWRDGLAEVRNKGLPLAGGLLAATIMVQLLGGLAILSGWQLQLGALALAGFTLVATLLFHGFWQESGARRRMQATTFLEHIALSAGLLWLAATAGGQP